MIFEDDNKISLSAHFDGDVIAVCVEHLTSNLIDDVATLFHPFFTAFFGCLLQFKLIMMMVEEYIYGFYVMEFKSFSYHNRHSFM